MLKPVRLLGHTLPDQATEISAFEYGSLPTTDRSGRTLATTSGVRLTCYRMDCSGHREKFHRSTRTFIYENKREISISECQSQAMRRMNEGQRHARVVSQRYLVLRCFKRADHIHQTSLDQESGDPILYARYDSSHGHWWRGPSSPQALPTPAVECIRINGVPVSRMSTRANSHAL